MAEVGMRRPTILERLILHGLATDGRWIRHADPVRCAEVYWALHREGWIEPQAGDEPYPRVTEAGLRAAGLPAPAADARDLHATLSEVLMAVDRTDPCEHDESEAGLCVFCRARELLERCAVYAAVPA